MNGGTGRVYFAASRKSSSGTIVLGYLNRILLCPHIMLSFMTLAVEATVSLVELEVGKLLIICAMQVFVGGVLSIVALVLLL